MNVNNVLAKTNPVSESILIENAKKFLDVEPSKLEAGIGEFLDTVAPHAQNYKLVVNVISFKKQAEAQAFAGARWDAQQDGTWVYALPQSLVTVTWIKV